MKENKMKPISNDEFFNDVSFDDYEKYTLFEKFIKSEVERVHEDLINGFYINNLIAADERR